MEDRAQEVGSERTEWAWLIQVAACLFALAFWGYHRWKDTKLAEQEKGTRTVEYLWNNTPPFYLVATAGDGINGDVKVLKQGGCVTVKPNVTVKFCAEAQ